MTTSELVHVGGRTLVAKRADPTVALDAARLAREATMLAMARHPGVVELADPIDPTPAIPGAPPSLELRTLFAGARTLAAADLDPLAAARALAAAAGTVADLHALGLVHGRIEPDHIVLTGSGRAVLCGFAEAGLAGDLGGDGQLLVPSLDVAGLGSVLDRVLSDADGHRQRRTSGLDRTTAGRLVDRATAADPALRPSARTFAAALAASLPRSPEPPGRSPRAERVVPRPGADPPDRPDPDSPDPDPSGPDTPVSSTSHRTDQRHPCRGRRLLAATGAVIAAVSLGIGINALTNVASRATPPLTGAVDRTDTAVVDPEHAGVGPQPGGALDVDGHHLTLGTSDDQVLRAVWSCSAPEAVVLVRSDGSVFRFDGLAAPGRDVTGVLVGRVPEGAVVELVTGADGCTALQARTIDRTVTLSIPSTATP